MKKRVLVTGGGTGGHLYPALAVVEKLQQDPEIGEILYIGNKGRKEAELVPQYGIRFIGLTFSGMPRGLNLSFLPWLMDLITTFLQARQHIRAFQPDVAFGTGGYITAPVLLAAKSLWVPYVIHEPDAHPGLVNRLMAHWASAVTCAFAQAREGLKTRALHVTGNPLRSQMGETPKADALARLKIAFQLNKPVLLVTGGSQGARRINQAVIQALPDLIETHHLQIIHGTGEKLYQEVLGQIPTAYQNHPAYVVKPFITDMGAALALADIALSRSGSMSLSEMYQAHVPTLLIPYPHAAADHQRKNALASQNAGASLMIEDSDCTGEKLIAVLSDLLADASKLDAMRQAASRLATPQATNNVVSVIKSVMSRE